MFCKNCGSQMNDDAAFCPNCGSKNDSKSNVSYNNVSTGQKNHKPFPVAPIIIAVFVVVVIFGVNAFLNRTCSMCDRKVFKKGLCREHYSEQLVKDNVKGVISGDKSLTDAITDAYDSGLTTKEKNRLKDTANNIKGNIDDVKSGKKDIFDAAQDIYDKNLTKKEKQQVEEKFNDIKNSLGDLFK